MASVGLSPQLLDLLQLRIWLETVFFPHTCSCSQANWYISVQMSVLCKS